MMVIRKGMLPRTWGDTAGYDNESRSIWIYFGRQQHVENVNIFDVRNIHEDDAAEYRPDDVLSKIGQLHWPGFVEMGRAVVRGETVDDDLPKSRYQRHLLILSIDDNQLVRDIISKILVKDV